MSGKIVNIKIIKEHSQLAFEEETNAYVKEQQDAGHVCHVQYAPLMLPAGKPIYMGMIEVRRA